MSAPQLLRGGPPDGVLLGRLDAVCDAVGGRLLAGDGGIAVSGAAADTRAVRPGDLFCALRGARVDAHALLPEAFAAGAAAVLVDRPCGDAWDLADVPPGRGAILVPAVTPALGRLASRHLRALHPGPTVVGVTGSVGKTTARRLVAAALGDAGQVLVPEESFNTDVSVPLICLRAAPRHRFAVLELAMRGPGQIAHLARVTRPRVGVLTVIGESHLEALGSIAAIAEAKGELLRALPPDGFAICNADDPRQRAMEAWSPAPVRTYGLHPDADVSARDLRPRPSGGGWTFEVRLRGSGRALSARISLLGRHHVQLALAALCCAEVLGVDLAGAAAGLEGVAPDPGRLALRPAGPLLLLDDTFNAAPQSVLAAIDTLCLVAPPGRRAAVLGDMLELGAASDAGHEAVGRSAGAAGLDWLVTVGPLAGGIARAARDAGMAPERVRETRDASHAAAVLPPLLQAAADGTVVLFKASHAAGLESLVAAAEAWSVRDAGGHGARRGR